METEETFEHTNDEPIVNLNLEAQGYLRECAKWAILLGILGFIIAGFIVLAAIFIGTIQSRLGQFQQTGVAGAASGAIGGLYLLGAILYFFFSLYLYQFGTRIKKGLIYHEPADVTKGLEKLKSFFKLWGITTIVFISFYVLIIIGVFVFSLAHRP